MREKRDYYADQEDYTSDEDSLGSGDTYVNLDTESDMEEEENQISSELSPQMPKKNITFKY